MLFKNNDVKALINFNNNINIKILTYKAKLYLNVHHTNFKAKIINYPIFKSYGITVKRF